MNLIYLGCSLSSLSDKPARLAALLNANLINFAVPAGSNALQHQRLQEYVLTNNIFQSDIVVWQLTYNFRAYTRLKYNRITEAKNIQKEFETRSRFHYVDSSINLFDRQPRIDLLCNSPMNQTYNRFQDFENELQQILYSLIMLQKVGVKLLVYLGAQNVLPETYKKILFDNLSKNNIPFITQGFLDWVAENKLPIDDTLHPEAAAGVQFADTVLYPMIQTLQRTNT